MIKTTMERLTSRCPIYDTVQQLLQSECGSRLAEEYTGIREQAVVLDIGAYQARLYRSALDLPAEWDQLAGGGRVFLSRNYLLAWEETLPEGMEIAYVVLERMGIAAGIMSLQIIDFRIGDALPRWAWMNIGVRVLVCGAAQVSGPFGFAFSPEVEAGEQSHLVQLLLERLRKRLNARAILVKDLPASACPLVQDGLQNKGYIPFNFEPNMILEVDPGWHTLEDFLEAMTSKYRVRARRAFRKGDSLGCRSLTLADLDRYKVRMHELYSAVADRADFSLIRLQPGYFSRLKRAFGASFKVIGYFDEEELVGFCSVLRSGVAAEVHFLGFDEAYNESAQLYLNMLLACIRTGIEDFGSRQIILGRTATVIKSSVGGYPQPQQVWLKHGSPIVQALLPRIVGFLQPPMEKTEGIRHPFGTE
ncbi:MAG: GNAT family N-acetyltransferase [Phaeodactylibacter xiamenensis]|jgi:predicted N-acyltransferase|nr:GNAT family N-acetyltransferase [Phaeodactylibacter xiamenensis]MCR9052395.1 GNAT family N-acetyltransferase [bacterium]